MFYIYERLSLYKKVPIFSASHKILNVQKKPYYGFLMHLFFSQNIGRVCSEICDTSEKYLADIITLFFVVQKKIEGLEFHNSKDTMISWYNLLCLLFVVYKVLYALNVYSGRIVAIYFSIIPRKKLAKNIAGGGRSSRPVNDP